MGVPWLPLLQVKHWVLITNVEGRPLIEPRLKENILEHWLRTEISFSPSQLYLLVLVVLSLSLSLGQVVELRLRCHGRADRWSTQSLS